MYGEFKNSASGFRRLVKWVEQHSNGIDPSLWLFCGENTGGYSNSLCNFLYGKGYDMWLENVRSIRGASGIRRMKSDRADASMIAEYAMRYCDKSVVFEPLGESLYQLHELFLYRQALIKHRRCFQVRRGEKKLTMEKSPVKTMILQSGRHVVSMLNKEIEKLDKRIAELTDSDGELWDIYQIVTSVPGVGCQNAVCLIVYTDNFRRFNHNPRKIACYYGAPFGRDSGTSVHAELHVHYMVNQQIKAMLS